MGNFITIVVVPCVVWGGLFILVWGIDKLWVSYKLKRRNNGTPTTGVNSREDVDHE